MMVVYTLSGGMLRSVYMVGIYIRIISHKTQYAFLFRSRFVPVVLVSLYSVSYEFLCYWYADDTQLIDLDVCGLA